MTTLAEGRQDDDQPLWDAYIAAIYLLNRYRHLHAGRPVRDLDEAEVAFEVRKKKLEQWAASPHAKDAGDE